MLFEGLSVRFVVVGIRVPDMSVDVRVSMSPEGCVWGLAMSAREINTTERGRVDSMSQSIKKRDADGCGGEKMRGSARVMSVWSYLTLGGFATRPAGSPSRGSVDEHSRFGGTLCIV